MWDGCSPQLTQAQSHAPIYSHSVLTVGYCFCLYKRIWRQRDRNNRREGFRPQGRRRGGSNRQAGKRRGHHDSPGNQRHRPARRRWAIIESLHCGFRAEKFQTRSVLRLLRASARSRQNHRRTSARGAAPDLGRRRFRKPPALEVPSSGRI